MHRKVELSLRQLFLDLAFVYLSAIATRRAKASETALIFRKKEGKSAASRSVMRGRRNSGEEERKKRSVTPRKEKRRLGELLYSSVDIFG